MIQLHLNSRKFAFANAGLITQMYNDYVCTNVN